MNRLRSSGLTLAERTDPARRESNPFPGPKAYQRLDQGYFFGRTDEIEELTSLVLSSSATLLYAPSGAGKSSLLQAGVAPYLESRFKFVILPTVRLDAGSRAQPAEDGTNRFVQAVCDTIADGDEATGADIAAAARTRRRDGSERVLLVLDQFEEVFHDRGLWRERHQFFVALTEALEANTWLRAIISLRSDYLAELVPYERSLPANLVVRYQLSDMVQEEAAEVIAEAFAHSGLELGDTNLRVVLDALYGNATTPEQGPASLQYANTIQLQIVCRTLWDELRAEYVDGPVPDGVLSVGAFNLRSSMVQFVDEAIREVMQRGHGGEAAVRWWLEHELITPLGRRAFVVVDQDETAGLPGPVIDALEDVRLVQLEKRHGLRLAELTHDSMIDGVRASNEAWRCTTYRRRRRAWVTLLIVLIALLAAFGPLRVDRSGIVAGPLVGTLGDSTQLSFTGRAGQAIIVSGAVYGHTNDVSAEVVEVQPSAGARVIAAQPLPAGAGTSTIFLAARTVPGRAYVARLVARGDETTAFDMRVFSRPIVSDDASGPLVARDAPGVGVLLEPAPNGGQASQLQPGGVLIDVDDPTLRFVAGAQIAVWDEAQEWVVVNRPREPGVAVLEFDPVSPEAEQNPVKVRQAAVDPPVRLDVDESVRVNVDPLGRISIEVGEVSQAGAELMCDGSEPVKVSWVTAGRTLASPTNVGRGGTVLPLSGGSGPSELALYSPDDAATCTVGVKTYGAAPIAANGRRELEVPRNAQAVAHAINLAEDAALVIKDSGNFLPSLTCGSSSGDFAESNGQRLAIVPAGSPCELWLVRSSASTDPVSVSVWVSELGERQGG